MKFTFESLYNITEEAVKIARKPFIKRQNIRAVDAAIDNAELDKNKLEEEIRKLLSIVSEGEIIKLQNVIDNRRKIKEIDENIKDLTEFKNEFFK